MGSVNWPFEFRGPVFLKLTISLRTLASVMLKLWLWILPRIHTLHILTICSKASGHFNVIFNFFFIGICAGDFQEMPPFSRTVSDHSVAHTASEICYILQTIVLFI